MILVTDSNSRIPVTIQPSGQKAILSGDNTVSCAHCHHPASGFTNNRAVATGIAAHRSIDERRIVAMSEILPAGW